MMKLTEQIKTAETPRAAMLLLASAIDDLRAVQSITVDPWEHWSDEDDGPMPMPTMSEMADAQRTVNAARSQQLDAKHAAIAALQERRANEHDPAEIRALDAQIRLAKDTGQALPPIVPEGNRPKITHEGIEVVPVSKARQAGRLSWARERKLHEFIGQGFTEEAAARSYAKGGPMWLYQGNRDAVMSMPFNYRQELVREIALDSEADAQEAGRDILKSMDSTERDITVQAIENLSGR